MWTINYPGLLHDTWLISLFIRSQLFFTVNRHKGIINFSVLHKKIYFNFNFRQLPSFWLKQWISCVCLVQSASLFYPFIPRCLNWWLSSWQLVFDDRNQREVCLGALLYKIAKIAWLGCVMLLCTLLMVSEL